jgi:phosphotransferase system HPr (HPr) family protein
MTKREVIIKTDHGLHARPAAQFVKKASSFASDIVIAFKDKEINGKSILAVTSLGATKDDQITLKATGSDEAEAIKSLAELIEALEN